MTPEPEIVKDSSVSRRRPNKRTRRCNWTVISGAFRTDVHKDVFMQGLYNGLLRLSGRAPRLAHVREDVVATLSKESNRLEYNLREIPEVDPAGVKSWWPALIERQGLLAGFN